MCAKKPRGRAAKEEDYKKEIDNIFKQALKIGIQKWGVNGTGMHLGELFRSTEKAVVEKVVPRAIQKHATGRVRQTLMDLIKEDPEMLFKLREVGVAIANSLRPLAGNRFRDMVVELISPELKRHDLRCVTKSDIVKQLSKALTVPGELELQPDIDIVIYDDSKQRAIAVLSCKTTLAERVLQTIRWKEYIGRLPGELQEIKVFLVTLWENFGNTTNRNRARQMDGAYSCMPDVQEDDKVKKFDKLIPDLIKLKAALN